MQLQTNAIPERLQSKRKEKGNYICLGPFHVPGFVLDAFSSRLAFQFSQGPSEVIIIITPILQARKLYIIEASGLFKALLR